MIRNTLRLILLATLGLAVSGCEDPQIYGSVGFSSYSGGGYYGGGGIGTSISIGGRIR
ncbi:MAG: hypothetical protein PVH91_08750 [Pseudomonadales bacterium]|jgi:hypothetical protein